MENNKWLPFSQDKSINFTFQTLNFSDYSKYSNQKFLLMEQKSSFFWDGSFENSFYSLPSTLLVSLILMGLFYLTFDYRISRYFRPYSLFFTFYVLTFENDISYLSFLSFSNAMNLFSYKFQDKIGHIIWVFVFFLLILFCVGGFFLSRILYKKL